MDIIDKFNKKVMDYLEHLNEKAQNEKLSEEEEEFFENLFSFVSAVATFGFLYWMYCIIG